MFGTVADTSTHTSQSSVKIPQQTHRTQQAGRMEPKHLPDLGHGPESSFNDTIMLGVSAGFQVLRLLVRFFFFYWNVDEGIATLHMWKSLSCRNTREICLLKAKFKQSFFLPFKIKGLFLHFNEAFSPVGLELLTARQRQVGFPSTSSSSRRTLSSRVWTLRNVCDVSSVAPLFQLKREAKPVRKHWNNLVFVQVVG